MTENRRIALNTVATYGRSIFGVLCGIFSTRWVLEALGQVDFGLYGLIGSMVIFISFLNIQFASAIARYYAYAIGAAKASMDNKSGMEECRAWFSIAVLIHLVLPGCLLAVGYPVGIHAIDNGWIEIPPDRLSACVWLWRFVCASCFVGMLNVPFQAMFTAKQYISELTIYSFMQTVMRTAFIGYMVSHPRDWLVGYGLGMFAVSVIPSILVCIRAHWIFPECRFQFRFLKQLWRVRKLGSYAFWQGIGGSGYIASHQGMSILVNNSFGPRLTGSFSVAETVAGEAASLTGALQGAFAPAITTAYGEGNMVRMRDLAYHACRYGTLLTMLFAVPMALEIDTLLRIWLKDPPPYASEMCLCALAFITIEKLSTGHLTAVNASGRVARFQLFRGLLRVSVIPIALLFYFMQLGVSLTVMALPISAGMVVLCDVWLARTRVGMDVVRWLKEVLCPLMAVGGISLIVGFIPHLSMVSTLGRLFVSTILALVAMLTAAWWIVLSNKERERIARMVLSCIKRLVVLGRT